MVIDARLRHFPVMPANAAARRCLSEGSDTSSNTADLLLLLDTDLTMGFVTQPLGGLSLEQATGWKVGVRLLEGARAGVGQAAAFWIRSWIFGQRRGAMGMLAGFIRLRASGRDFCCASRIAVREFHPQCRLTVVWD